MLMNHYDEFLSTLHLDAANIAEICPSGDCLNIDESESIVYYRINEAEACAVVTGLGKDYPKSNSIDSEVASLDPTVLLPVRMVYFHKSNHTVTSS